jgi:hypothetical protein
MTRSIVFLAVAGLLNATPALAQAPRMSFFITSRGPGTGADLGGLEGADAYCDSLARAAGSSGLIWRAYLSGRDKSGKPMNARDRIGSGPWHNAKGVQVASSVDDLHSENNKLSKENSLTERGAVVNGRGDSPNMHDILTGSTSDGRLTLGADDTTCDNWSSTSPNGKALVGHHDRVGGGPNPTSWNSSHPSRGCGQSNLVATGGNGLFYCFGTPGA